MRMTKRLNTFYFIATMSSTTGLVLFDYVAGEEDELTIYQGEKVSIIDTYDDGWWLVDNNNHDRGLVPSNYLTTDIKDKPNKSNEIAKKNKSPTKQNDEPASNSNMNPIELKRLRAMREQAETKINALRTAVSNHESESITRRKESVSHSAQFQPTPRTEEDHEDSAYEKPVVGPAKEPNIKQKASKKNGVGSSRAAVESQSPTKIPIPPNMPQVALDQSSLNFISKIINERLDKEFSVRDERIIDKVKTLLSRGDPGYVSESSPVRHQPPSHSRRVDNNLVSDSESVSNKSPRPKSKIPRVYFPKLVSAPKVLVEKSSSADDEPKDSKVHAAPPPTSAPSNQRLPQLKSNSAGANKKVKAPKPAAVPGPSGDRAAMNSDGEIHSVKEKPHQPTASKTVVVDATSQSIRYPQCRSVVYPPTNHRNIGKSSGSNAPSSDLVLQHVHGLSSGLQGKGSALQLLKDNRMVFPAACVVVLMDPQTRTQAFFAKHTGEVTAVAVHPNRQIVASAGQVGKETCILLWNSAAIKAGSSAYATVNELKAPAGIRGVSSLSFSGDGKYLAAVGSDESHSLLIFRLSDGSLVASSKINLIAVSQVLFNPFAFSTKDSEDFVDTELGCYTLVAYGGKQIKFYTLRVVVDTAQHSNSGKGQRPSPSKSQPDQMVLQYLLEGHLGVSNASVEQPDLTCCVAVDDSTEIPDEDEEPRYYGRQPASRLFTGSSAGSVLIWQQAVDEVNGYGFEHCWLPRGKVISVVTEVHDSPLLEIAYFSSGHGEGKQNFLFYERLLTSGTDGSLNLWSFNRTDDKNILPLEHIHAFELESKEPVSSIAWDSLGDMLVMSTTEHSVVSVAIANDEDSGSSISVTSEDVLTSHRGKIKRLAVNPLMPSLFATLGSDKTVRLWEATALRQIGALKLPYNGTAIAFSADGKSLAVGSDHGELVVYSSAEFSALLSQSRKKVLSMLCAPIVALALNNWTVALKRNVTTQSNVVVSPHKASQQQRGAKKQPSANKHCDIVEIKFSPSGDAVALGCRDNLIHILSVSAGYKHSAVCRGHSSFIKHLDFSVDSKVLQSCDAAREILFWDAVSGQQLTSADDFRDVEWSSWSSVYGWAVHGAFNDEQGQSAVEGEVNCVGRSPDQTLLLCGNHSNNLKLFNYPCVSTSVPAVYSGHASSVSDVSFLRSGQKLDDVIAVSVGSTDSCIMQWKVVNY